MKYRESQKDRKLRLQFAEDMTRAHLKRIWLQRGELRGLNSLDISFEFPITAIAGKNGAGKSTILALACCAFHASPDGFKLPKRKFPHYTFSDFFIQHGKERSLQGITLYYFIAHHKWKPSERLPTGNGVGRQVRRKHRGGKWTDYSTRVKRTVVFLGIERIVPHSERSQSKSYARVFKDAAPKGWEDKVKDFVGRILGKEYADFRYVEHSKYSLPIVRVNDVPYSGFNMGAGENALFEIFSTIYAAGDGALLVLDEIELGLHVEAQRRFIECLKDVCLAKHIQVICTTHSKEILDCLPPEARYFVENLNGDTRVTQAISPEFALSKLGAVSGLELDVYVEDDVAKAIVLAAMPVTTRTRTVVKTIGSAKAVARQLAANYLRGESKPVLAIYDGDQRQAADENFAHAQKMTERADVGFKDWYESRVSFLPGNTWPEAWLLEVGYQKSAALGSAFGTDGHTVMEAIKKGRLAGKHREFHEISSLLGLDVGLCLHYFAAVIAKERIAEIEELRINIEAVLAANA